ncbi:MAG: DUF2283 domain-containing protein [Acidobacteriota bacterium]
MRVHYDPKVDLLYIRLDEKKQKVINKRIFEDVVLDIGRNNRIVGIEILDASKHMDVRKIFPVKTEGAYASSASRQTGS